MLALSHCPSPHMHACQRTYIDHTTIDYQTALKQHAEYCQKLTGLGVQVRTLEMNQEHPDCTFIEDLAIVLDEVAILASMGSQARSQEPLGIQEELCSLREVYRVAPPATIEGGDVLRVGRTLLVGVSTRTNREGVANLTKLVAAHDYRVRPIPVQGCLHLKTACSALPDGRLLINPAWVDVDLLDDYPWLAVPHHEPWAANTLPIHGHVVLSAHHVATAELVSELGFETELLDISEFSKAEGGVTCLSLLFE